MPPLILDLRVTPKAGREAITGWHDGRLKLSVTAAPEDGKANAAVIRLLARTLGVPRSCISLQSGETRRDKRVAILAEARILERLPPR